MGHPAQGSTDVLCQQATKGERCWLRPTSESRWTRHVSPWESRCVHEQWGTEPQELCPQTHRLTKAESPHPRKCMIASNVQTMADNKRWWLHGCFKATHFFHVHSSYLQARILNFLFSQFSRFLFLFSTRCCLSQSLFWLNSERPKKSNVRLGVHALPQVFPIGHCGDRLDRPLLLFLYNKQWSSSAWEFFLCSSHCQKELM